MCNTYVDVIGIWNQWIEQQNTHEANVKVDEGKKDAKAVMQPGWFQQEIPALYPS